MCCRLFQTPVTLVQTLCKFIQLGEIKANSSRIYIPLKQLSSLFYAPWMASESFFSEIAWSSNRLQLHH